MENGLDHRGIEESHTVLMDSHNGLSDVVLDPYNLTVRQFKVCSCSPNINLKCVSVEPIKNIL